MIPSRVAAGVHVMKMCQAFANLGHHVILVIPDYTIDQANAQFLNDPYAFYGVKDNFEIRRMWLPRVPGRMAWFAFEAMRFVREQHPDIVYGRHALGTAAQIFNHVPIVLELHYEVWRRGRLDYYAFRRLMHSHYFRRLVLISESLKTIYVDRGACPAKKIMVAPNGADIPHEDTELLPVALKGRSDAPKVGFFGHLYEGCGLDMIIAVARKMPDVDFHIFGGTAADFSAYADGQNNLTNVLHYPHIIPNLVARAQKHMHILLAPYQDSVKIPGKNDSSTYMSPLKLFEYMAAKRPMVCSNLPALQEIVDDECAVMVPANAAPVWAEAIRRLINDRALRQRLSENAFRRLAERHTWQKRAAVVLQGL